MKAKMEPNVPDEKSIRRMVRSVVYRTLGLAADEQVRTARPMITELDVRDLPVDAQLPIPDRALITPLARQVAMERGISFVPASAGETKHPRTIRLQALSSGKRKNHRPGGGPWRLRIKGAHSPNPA